MKWGVITVRLPHLTDVPQVVTVVVAEREVVLAVVAVVFPCLAVALLEQVLVDSSVPQCESTAEQGVRTAGVKHRHGPDIVARRVLCLHEAGWQREGCQRHDGCMYLVLVHVYVYGCL